MPKPFDRDHSHVELLKRKSFALNAEFPEGWQDKGVLKTLNEMIPEMPPVWEILDETFPG